jgi:hypothetical protein
MFCALKTFPSSVVCEKANNYTAVTSGDAANITSFVVLICLALKLCRRVSAFLCNGRRATRDMVNFDCRRFQCDVGKEGVPPEKL